MARVNTLVTSLSSGQLSPRLRARADTRVYQDGALRLDNCVPMLQGGWEKRPGTLHMAPLSAGTRIEGRVFGRAEAYVFALSADRLDIYRVGASALTHVGGFDNMPWTAETVWFIQTAWLGNLCVLVDASFRPRLLTRVGINHFTMASVTFATDEDGIVRVPRTKFAAEDVTLDLSATTGTVTVTASGPVFQNDHVGEQFAIRGGFVSIIAVGSPTSATGVIASMPRSPLDPNALRVTAGSTRVVVTLVAHGVRAGDVVEITETTDVGADIDGLHAVNLNGARTVVEVLDEDRFVITASNPAGRTEDGGGAGGWVATAAATRRWSEPVFSAVRGWPQAAAFHNGRLWLGGPPSLGDAAFGSVSRQFFSFDAGEGQPDDAVTAIGETQTNSVRRLVSAGNLLAFGDTGEASFMSGDQSPINQANIEGKPATQIGSSYMAPLLYDGAVLFGDAIGQHIYEFAYVDAFAAYSASPISALSPEVLNGPVHAQAYSGAPTLATSMAVFTNIDGTAAIYHGRRAEQTSGWAPWSTNGQFRSFAGVGERLFTSVTRQVNGSPVHAIEEFIWAGVFTDDTIRLDSATPTTLWAAPHFGIGAVLDVVDAQTKAYLGRVTTGPLGGFVLEQPATEILVGRPVEAVIETMPPAAALPEGPQLGELMAVPRSVVHLHRTSYARINRSVFTAQKVASINDVLTPVTTEHEVWRLGWSRDPTIRVSSDLPLPMGVLGVLMEVTIGERMG